MSDFKFQFLIAAKEELSRVASQAGKGLEDLEERFKKVNKASDKLQDIGASIFKVGAAITAVAGLGVKAFSDLESSSISLQNVLGGVNGMDEHFQSINKKAVELGNTLPGATSDFYDLATALRRGGSEAANIDDGLLEAAASLKVVKRLSSEVAGEGLATTAQAFNLTGQEAIKMADIINRTSNASRLQVGGFFEAMKYIGAPSKMLGLTGLKNATDMSTLMGSLSNTGIDPSQVGSAFSQGVQHIAGIKTRLQAARGALWGDAGDILNQKGIKLDFFDDQGKTDIPRMVAQFDKLKGLNEEQRLKIGTTLFGAEGSRLALITSEAYNTTARKQLNGEHLNAQMKRETDSLKAKLENVFGSSTNAAARFFGPVGEALKGLLDKTNSLISRFDGWAERNPKIAAGVAFLVTGLGLLLTVGGGAIFIAAKMVTAWTGVCAVFPILNIGIFASVKALWALAVAFMATPIGWICAGIIAVIAVGVLLWKNWDRIYNWFKATFPALFGVIKSTFDDLKEAAAKLWQSFKMAWDAMAEALRPVMKALGALWEKFKPFLGPILKAIAVVVFGPMAVALGAVVVAIYLVVKWVTLMLNIWEKLITVGVKVWNWIKGFAGNMFEAGSNLVKSVAKGMMAAISHPIEAIKNVVKKVRGFLPFSPAKEGPLKDIHKIRLIETIAENMNPASLVDRMKSIATMARNAVPKLLTAGLAMAAAPLSMAASGGGKGPISITIHVDARGAAPGVEQGIQRAIMAAAPALKRELERLGESDSRRRF